MSDTAWDSGRLRGAGDPVVVFGFQHEDSTAEAKIFAEGGGGRALCIASGGETAFSLLAAGALEVVAIDVNSAQLRLVELKRSALRAGRIDCLTEDASDILNLPGLSQEAVTFWKRHAATLRGGLCFCGIVERRTRLFGPVLRGFARKPNGLRWRMGWSLLRPALALGYGARFRSRLPLAWSDRLAKRIADRLRDRADDPLLLAELGLSFGPAGLTVYSPDSVARILVSLDRLRLVPSDLASFLRDRPSESWAMIALSNIGDTMSGDERIEMLTLVARHLQPGGILVLRSIVYPVDAVPDLPELEWLPIPVESGVICPVIGIGRKKDGSSPPAKRPP